MTYVRSLKLAIPEFPEVRSYSLELMDFSGQLPTCSNVASNGNNGLGDLLEGIVVADHKQLIK